MKAMKNMMPEKVKKKLQQIAKKYSLKYSGKNLPELCFACLLDDLLRQASKKNPRIEGQLRKKEAITLVDVGSGYFRYGNALNNVMKKINPTVKLFAVDKDQRSQTYDPGFFIKSDINKSTEKLKKQGVQQIDVFTVFNPFPGMPDFRKVKAELGRDALLMGCVDWNLELFKKSLEMNGYKAIAWQENYLREEMKPWFNTYSLFAFAVSKQSDNVKFK